VRSVNALIVAGSVKNFLQKVSRRDVKAPLGLRFSGAIYLSSALGIDRTTDL
jgi:hypothetical protein